MGVQLYSSWPTPHSATMALYLNYTLLHSTTVILAFVWLYLILLWTYLHDYTLDLASCLTLLWTYLHDYFGPDRGPDSTLDL